MPPTRKRKGSPSLEDDAAAAEHESSKRRFVEEAAAGDDAATGATTAPETPPTAPGPDLRAARFAALRARNQASRRENLRETKSEAQRASVDPAALTSLHRKREVAQHKLLRAEVEDSGEDFERKRAWDWTAEESERWDAKQAEKQRRRAQNAFQDYSAEAGKVYERQVGLMGKSREEWEGRRADYEREKAEVVERAVRSGGLELVEGENGELMAVDKTGDFYAGADGVGHIGKKPGKAAVDRLVADIKKAEEVRLKKRRERGINDDEGRDITYINEKNKQFNLKLARFYDKYTADIRESFERGTAI